MAEQVIDPETLSLEELRVKTQEAFEQPRDEKGRFTKVDFGDELGAPAEEEKTEAEEVKAEEPEPEQEPQPEERVYIVRREIDLGDGAGVQVFKGVGKSIEEATDDFADKLAEAQRNASIKIRKQEARLRELEGAKKQEGQDEDYVLNQRAKDNPVEAMREVVRRELERKAREEQSAREAKIAEERIALAFIQSTPEYHATPRNGVKMEAWLRTHGLQLTQENLEKAFKDLSESGLLELKPEEADGTTAAEGVETERIAQPRPEATQPRGRRSSTVRGGAPPSVKSGPSEAELYSMPMEQLAAKTREAFLQKQE